MLKTAIDRRALLTGRGLVVDPVVTPPGGEIASVLVQVRPERIEEVASAIAGLPGCEIHSRDPRGKLVVVTEAPDAGSLGTMLNTIQSLRDVYSAALVFHAIET